MQLRNKIGRRPLLLLLCAALSLLALAEAPAFAKDKENNGDGKYGPLTAQWWQWVDSLPAVDVVDSNGQPTNTHPLLDSTGAYATAGQANGIDPLLTPPQLRKVAADFIATVSDRYARLNGKDLEIMRVRSPVFSYTLPAENSIYAYFGSVGPQFEGTVYPAVSDGYWVVIPSLAPGTYKLEFGATALYNGSPFSVAVTDNITVK